MSPKRRAAFTLSINVSNASILFFMPPGASISEDPAQWLSFSPVAAGVAAWPVTIGLEVITSFPQTDWERSRIACESAFLSWLSSHSLNSSSLRNISFRASLTTYDSVESMNSAYFFEPLLHAALNTKLQCLILRRLWRRFQDWHFHFLLLTMRQLRKSACKLFVQVALDSSGRRCRTLGSSGSSELGGSDPTNFLGG